MDRPQTRLRILFMSVFLFSGWKYKAGMATSKEFLLGLSYREELCRLQA